MHIREASTCSSDSVLRIKQAVQNAVCGRMALGLVVAIVLGMLAIHSGECIEVTVVYFSFSDLGRGGFHIHYPAFDATANLIRNTFPEWDLIQIWRCVRDSDLRKKRWQVLAEKFLCCARRVTAGQVLIKNNVYFSHLFCYILDEELEAAFLLRLTAEPKS